MSDVNHSHLLIDLMLCEVAGFFILYSDCVSYQLRPKMNFQPSFYVLKFLLKIAHEQDQNRSSVLSLYLLFQQDHLFDQRFGTHP
jgi:hypothetical protein